MKDTIKKMLDYQTIDGELNKLEKELEGSEDKKQAQKMLEIFKSGQQTADELEKEAAKAGDELEIVKKNYETNCKMAEKLTAINIEKLTDEQVVKLNADLETVLNTLSTIEKKLVALNKQVQTILTKFEQAKRNAVASKNNYSKYKISYENFLKEQEPKIQKYKTILAKMEKEVDSALFSKYKALRQDKLFPVIVSLNDNLCSGCRMSLSVNDLNKLKANGYAICENCRRIIYIKN